MVSEDFVAARVVTEQLQEQFAALSGDRNPMHMDALAARRTQAGLPVVHGVHTLLWALESLAEAGTLDTSLTRVKARFLKWVYLGDEAVLTASASLLQVAVQGMVVLSADLLYGATVAAEGEVAASPAGPLEAPLDLSFAQMDGRAGQAYAASRESCAAMFPRLTALFGSTVAELAATSYVIGMEAPGLHSMFSKLDLTLRPVEEDRRTALAYAVTYHDERFRKARVSVNGRGIAGTLEAFVRTPPVAQATMAELRHRIVPGEFAGMRALVVGGSRGLGELTAKLIALGGGEPTITYATGRKDAETVAAGIAANGGNAGVLPYDVRKAPGPQLAGASEPYTHVFYFATNAIFRPKGPLVSAPFLADFVAFYLQGFHDLVVELARGGRVVKAYYPSSVAVAERPAGMTEYAMIKAAGEEMCRDMNDHLPGVQVLMTRLPRLPTDQTAGVLPERDADPVDTMLPILREMQGMGVAE